MSHSSSVEKPVFRAGSAPDQRRSDGRQRPTGRNRPPPVGRRSSAAVQEASAAQARQSRCSRKRDAARVARRSMHTTRRCTRGQHTRRPVSMRRLCAVIGTHRHASVRLDPTLRLDPEEFANQRRGLLGEAAQLRGGRSTRQREEAPRAHVIAMASKVGKHIKHPDQLRSRSHQRPQATHAERVWAVALRTGNGGLASSPWREYSRMRW